MTVSIDVTDPDHPELREPPTLDELLRGQVAGPGLLSDGSIRSGRYDRMEILRAAIDTAKLYPTAPSSALDILVIAQAYADWVGVEIDD